MFRLFFSLMTVFLLMDRAYSEPKEAEVLLVPEQVIGKANRQVMGNNILGVRPNPEYTERGSGVWIPAKNAPNLEMVKLLKKAGTTSLRWPGGSDANSYKWTKTVGPGHQKFGLPEFLKLCELTGAEPVITVAEYYGSAADAADLVEYLNAPCDGSNPNGGKDWAAVRAKDGRKKPWNVTIFEYGNESYLGQVYPDYGASKTKIFSPQKYSRLYKEYRAAMKAVDPKIELGLVTDHNPAWFIPVLQEAGKDADFFIIHPYLPRCFEIPKNDKERRHVLLAASACGKKLQENYDDIIRMSQQASGRNNFRFRVTEYNTLYVEKGPVQLRQTLASTLGLFEHVRVMLLPRNRVASANFWQFANEFFGMVKEDAKGKLRKQSNFLLFELINDYWPNELIGSRTNCGSWNYKGGCGVEPVIKPGTLTWKNYTFDNHWKITPVNNVKQEEKGDVLHVSFTGPDLNYYHAYVSVPVKPHHLYEVTVAVDSSGFTSGSFGIGWEVIDERSFKVKCVESNEFTGGKGWQYEKIQFLAPENAKKMLIRARHLGKEKNSSKVSGQALLKVIKVREAQPQLDDSVSDLSVIAGRKGQNTLTAIIKNSNFDKDIPVKLKIAGGKDKIQYDSTTVECITGAEPWSNNINKEEVKRIKLKYTGDADVLRFVLPRHSIAAVRLFYKDKDK